MKGLELSEKYYRAFGESMIREQFPEWEGRIAVGLTGSGSECYGYDDEVSADHDFGPEFCLFLPEEEILDRRTAFRLERAYAKLPAEFEGYSRQKMGPAGGQRHGVFRRREYFREKLGCVPEEMTAEDWLRLPDWALAEAVNGKIFRDDAGEMTRSREILRDMQLPAVPETRGNRGGTAGGGRVCEPYDEYAVPAGEEGPAVLQMELPRSEGASGRRGRGTVPGMAADHRKRAGDRGGQVLLHGGNRIGCD